MKINAGNVLAHEYERETYLSIHGDCSVGRRLTSFRTICHILERGLCIFFVALSVLAFYRTGMFLLMPAVICSCRIRPRGKFPCIYDFYTAVWSCKHDRMKTSEIYYFPAYKRPFAYHVCNDTFVRLLQYMFHNRPYDIFYRNDERHNSRIYHIVRYS